MSNFEVPVIAIDDVVDHPDADRLSLNKIKGFVAISNKELHHSQGEAVTKESWKHRYRRGQLVVYVPEGAVVPDYLLKAGGYWDEDKQEGILAGSKGNRVKAIKLRGIISQGLILPFPEIDADGLKMLELVEEDEKIHVALEGTDVAGFLGITKYEPQIPSSMDGEVVYEPSLTLKFDLENAQRYPDVFEEEEKVYVTEKLHGTFAAFVFVNQKYADSHGVDTSNLVAFGDGLFATVYSKGLGSKGMVFRVTEENRDKNIYVRQLYEILGDLGLVLAVQDNLNYTADAVGGRLTILAEIYGKGIQDLHYSTTTPQYAVFGVVAGLGVYLSAMAIYDEDSFMNLFPLVPLIFKGRAGEVLANVEKYRDGKSQIDGETLREGIVIVPEFEGRDERIGRRALKLVSPNYLTRKNGTEYN